MATTQSLEQAEAFMQEFLRLCITKCSDLSDAQLNEFLCMRRYLVTALATWDDGVNESFASLLARTSDAP